MGRRGSAMDAIPGKERAGGVRSQGILTSTPACPCWGREDAVPGDEQSRGAHSQGVLVLFTTVIRWSVGVTLGFE